MATIKSYSDLQQSKKLAEILPHESADMTYCAVVEGARDKTTIRGWEIVTGTKKWEVSINAIKNNSFSYRNGYIVPCWSLAALLNIIQKTTPYKMEHFGDKKVQLTCVLGDKPWELIISDFDNEVDACYEMILKLHEQKML